MFSAPFTEFITGFCSSKVCFHCREPGHGVADCPAVLQSQDMGTGICYRCGSTEHDLSQCRAKVDPAAGGSQEVLLCVKCSALSCPSADPEALCARNLTFPVLAGSLTVIYSMK